MGLITEHAVATLPGTPVPEAKYFVKEVGSPRVKMYMTDLAGTLFPVGGGVNSVNGQSGNAAGEVQLELSLTGGSLSITGGTAPVDLDARYAVPDFVKAITETQIANWDTAYSWGNHALAGYIIHGTAADQVRNNTELDARYLQSYTETDPTVPAWVKAITQTQIANWDTAFGWGDHALAGYLLPGDNVSELINDAGYLVTEVDPVYEAEKGRYVRNDVANQQVISGFKVIGDTTGNANQAFIEFYESNGTVRKGYIGDTQIGNSDIYIGSDTGGVRIGFNGGEAVVSDTEFTYKGFDIYHEGNLDPTLYALKATTITGGTGVTGGGSLAANRVISLDFDYLDGRYLSGYKQKQAVRVATTGNVALSGLQTIDGVTLQAGDRVGVIANANAAENGIYVAASGAWARSADFDQAAPGEVEQGASFFVQEGVINGKTGWSLSTGGTITIGTTDLVFIQYAGANVYQAGTGIQLDGNIINAQVDDAIWNADSLQGFPIATDDPTTNQLLRYTGTNWTPWTPNFLVTETDPVWEAQKPNYYTKTNLQTSGQAQVNWGNITNVPADLGLQTLSLGASVGTVSISDGNTITLRSIASDNSEIFGELTFAGLIPTYSSAATGYPTPGGGGIFRRRLPGGTEGSFEIWKSTQNDGKLMFNVGTTGTSWNGWQTFASEEYVANNFITLGDTSPRLSAPGNTSGDLGSIVGASLSIRSHGAPNAPSWATSFGAVLSANFTNSLISRQLWFGRNGEIGIRGGASTFDEWYQLATKDDIPSLTNYVTTNTDQTITGEKSFPSSTYFNSSSAAQLIFQRNNASRWRLGYSTFAETGGNAGSNFVIHKVNDDGTVVNSIEIDRATNVVKFAETPTVGSNIIWHEGNFTPSDYLLATSPAGSITQADIDSWAQAAADAHTHANKAVLDLIGADGDDLTYNNEPVMHWATREW